MHRPAGFALILAALHLWTRRHRAWQLAQALAAASVLFNLTKGWDVEEAVCSALLAGLVGWMYWMGDNGWATFLLVWSLFVGSLDNFLRPLLIKRGADLPLLLIFAGVIGGMLGFGLVGIFVGPVVLAVTYTLLEAWIEDGLGKDDAE